MACLLAPERMSRADATKPENVARENTADSRTGRRGWRDQELQRFSPASLQLLM